jgi:hypothetical protein
VGRALASLTPQPLRPFVERVGYSAFERLPTPRSYLRCLGDLAVVPARAAGYAERLGVRPVDMKTAHDPMLSAPETLARLLEQIPA